MRFLPLIAPERIMSDAMTVEMSMRGLWLVVMGYFVSGIGAAFLLKSAAHGGSRLMAAYARRAAAEREAREIALARQARARALEARLTIRVGN